MREQVGFADIAPLLIDARRFLQLNFELIRQHPLRMYDFAHVWIPKKSLMRERYTAALGQTPRVLFGLPQSWQSSLVHVIPHTEYVKSVAFSPDGSRLASGSDKMVRIWNTATGELEDELEGHTHSVESVVFSHNGRFIVSGSRDMTIRIWNTSTCETTHMLTGHEYWVMSVAISRDDKFVVSGSGDRTVRIWDTTTGELHRELKGHGRGVESVVVSPDCQHVASVSLIGELWIWTKDGVIEHKLKCPAYGTTFDLAFSNDSCRILCNINRTEWTTTGHCLSPSDTDNEPGDAGHTWSVAYSPDYNEIIVYGTKDGEVIMWNRDTNLTHIVGGHGSGVRSVAFSPDGSRIASGSFDDTVRIWDPQLRGTINKEVSLGALNNVTLSCNGGWIVTSSYSHIQVWRVMETVTKVNELEIEGVKFLALSRDGNRVVIGCDDRSICVWNHLTNKKECQMNGHSHHITSVAFSYDGCHVVSGSYDKTVRIWDCHTGNEVCMYQHSDAVMSVTFSCDGGRVAFGSFYGRILIWNPSTGKIDMELLRPRQESDLWLLFTWDDRDSYQWTELAFTWDNSHVISRSRQNEVWIWNLTTKEYTQLSQRIQLPDGTRVHSLGTHNFHIYDPVDQEMTNNIPPYLLHIPPHGDWIFGEQVEHDCWIPRQYRDFHWAYVAKSLVCLGYWSGHLIVLNLKSTPHV